MNYPIRQEPRPAGAARERGTLARMASAVLPAIARAAPFAAAIVLGGVFLFAAVTKGGDPAAFAEQVVSYEIVGESAARAVVWVLVPLEAILGVALIVLYRRRHVAIATGALLVFFIGVVAWGWSQGKTEGCGCFGSLSSRGPADVIFEDLILLAFAVIATLPWRPSPAHAGIEPKRSGMFGLVKTGAVSLAGLLAVAYVAAAPALPIDDYVTALRPGTMVEKLHLTVLEQREGAAIVALLDLDHESISETVAALNDLAVSPGMPPIVAFADAGEQERGEFFWTHGPQFELHEAAGGSMRPLYRTLPRYFLMEEGRVTKTWNHGPPIPGDVTSSLSPDVTDSAGHRTLEEEQEG